MISNDILMELESLEEQKKNIKGTKCEVYSRVVGYHRPVENWNDGKKEEFNLRKTTGAEEFSFNK